MTVRCAAHCAGGTLTVAEHPRVKTRRSRSSDEEDLEAHCEVSVNGAGARSTARLKRPGYQNAFSECAVQTTATKRSTLAGADGPQSPSSYRDRSCFSF